WRIGCTGRNKCSSFWNKSRGPAGSEHNIYLNIARCLQWCLGSTTTCEKKSFRDAIKKGKDHFADYRLVSNFGGLCHYRIDQTTSNTPRTKSLANTCAISTTARRGASQTVNRFACRARTCCRLTARREG